MVLKHRPRHSWAMVAERVSAAHAGIDNENASKVECSALHRSESGKSVQW